MDIRRLTLQDHPNTKRRIESKAGAFSLWLEFEHWIPSPEDDLTNDFFNMQVCFEDGRTYALNVWTFAFFTRACEEVKAERRQEVTIYLRAPDLFVEKLEREHLEAVIKEMADRGQLAEEWLIDQSW